MIDVTLMDGQIENMKFAGTPSMLAGEISFTACFVYGQLYVQDKEAAEKFRRAFMEIVQQPFSWRHMIPDIEESDDEKEQAEPIVIDFQEALKKKQEEDKK